METNLTLFLYLSHSLQPKPSLDFFRYTFLTYFTLSRRIYSFVVSLFGTIIVLEAFSDNEQHMRLSTYIHCLCCVTRRHYFSSVFYIEWLWSPMMDAAFDITCSLIFCSRKYFFFIFALHAHLEEMNEKVRNNNSVRHNNRIHLRLLSLLAVWYLSLHAI